ncbi:MAG TPA: ribonuclease E [Xanthomonadaceae bacterium]|nr:ribonuclease E [Xanthomonadaceae bacterium]
MKRMLINATQAEELRVAIVDGQNLYDIDIEQPSKEQKKSNIYKGKITRLEPSLEAAFVEYGGERHGFLPLKEISRDYFQSGVDPNKATIKELLREGQEVVVQVDKEERGNKGAALTTFISLAGRYMVLMPNSPTAGGVSRRIEGDDRAELKKAMDALQIPDDMGVIIRTAGVGRDAEELQWDLDYLLQVWKAVAEAALTKPAPFLIYQESRLIIRALRDYMRPDIGEILVDTPEMYQEARDFVDQVMPHNQRKLKHYTDDTPLFNRFQIESQIENAYERTVRLPSGGALVIDQTEALTAIDVNSARATKGSDIEETAFHTNLEAAEEVARQMRLRDLGGLVVIDFIDMSSNKHQRDVENKLQNALRHDRARVQIGRISRFGLLEMSRQRLRPSLGESSQLVCPRCEGHGRMRSIESLSLSILRVAEEHAMKENTGQVLVQAPVEIANFLLNEKRSALKEIEARHDAPIVIVADDQLETPHYEVTRLRENELGEESARPSYQRGTPRKLPTHALTKSNLNIPALPAVRNVQPAQPAPMREPREPEVAQAPAPAPAAGPHREPGFVARLFGALFGAAEAPQDKQAREDRDRDGGRREARDGRGERRRDGRGESRGGRGGQGRDGRRDDQRRQKNRGDRPDKAEKVEKSEAADKQPQPQKQAQSPKKPRPPRGEGGRGRGQRNASPAADDPLKQSGEQATANADIPAGPGAAVATAAADASGGDWRKLPPPVEPSEDDARAQAGAGAGDAPDGADAGKEGAEGGRRRRGRRGGRRRRRGGDAAAAQDAGGDAPDTSGHTGDETGEDITAPKRSQPEFDFDDNVKAQPADAAAAAVGGVVAGAADTGGTGTGEASAEPAWPAAEPAQAPVASVEPANGATVGGATSDSAHVATPTTEVAIAPDHAPAAETRAVEPATAAPGLFDTLPPASPADAAAASVLGEDAGAVANDGQDASDDDNDDAQKAAAIGN